MPVSKFELTERFEVLLRLESTYYRIKYDYLAIPCHLDRKHWRGKVCNWMYDVIDRHRFDREMVAVAIHYLDRYTSRMHKHMRSTSAHNLVSTAALYLAAKVYRRHGESFPLDFFTSMLLDFTPRDFLDMEKSMLDTLDWRMHPPTPQSYLSLLIIMLPREACHPFTRHSLHERIKFLLELSVSDPYFFGRKPSRIAIAAFLEVIESAVQPNVPKWTYRTQFRNRVGDIVGIDCDARDVADCRRGLAVYMEATEGAMASCAQSPNKSSSRRASVVSP